VELKPWIENLAASSIIIEEAYYYIFLLLDELSEPLTYESHLRLLNIRD